MANVRLLPVLMATAGVVLALKAVAVAEDATSAAPPDASAAPSTPAPKKTAATECPPPDFATQAGLSATGDIFSAIAQRAGSTVAQLSVGLEAYKPGQTGLLRLTWDNGDRTVLVNPDSTARPAPSSPPKSWVTVSPLVTRCRSWSPACVTTPYSASSS